MTEDTGTVADGVKNPNKEPKTHEVSESSSQVHDKASPVETKKPSEPEQDTKPSASKPDDDHEPSIESSEPKAPIPSEERPSTPTNKLEDILDKPTSPTSTTSSPAKARSRGQSIHKASEWSHQVQIPVKETVEEETEEWQEMPAYAPFDMYNDENKLVAREHLDDEEEDQIGQKGGATKGYTRVQDDDAQSATSMDEDTAYLFKAPKTNVLDEEDEEGRDMATQMQTTKTLLTEGQRIAYVGIVRLAMLEMIKTLNGFKRTKGTKKLLETVTDSMTMWSQMIMLRMYAHMEIESAEQVMIEQLSEHGVQPQDLTPSLMQHAKIRNPMKEEDEEEKEKPEEENENQERNSTDEKKKSPPESPSLAPAYESARPSIDSRLDPKSPMSPTSGLYDAPIDHEDFPDVAKSIKSPTSDKAFDADDKSKDDNDDNDDDDADLQTLADIADKKNLDIDIRWTILCDLFLILISDSNYDARSRQLLESVGKHLEIDWMDICKFEKRIIEALEVQEAADKEDWNEDEHMEKRRKAALRNRFMVMGLATVGGGLIIGLSMGLLAPVIGAGLAAGFTTFGITGTTGFLAGAGGAAIITSTGVVAGSNVGFKASNRRTGSVKTFEYRPLHNNKRPNLIVTVAGWLTGKVDDVRLPFSTVDPIMGDIYSVYWEPEMLRSMGDTINILATEALTQALQQILGSTILTALMAAIQLPIVLTKLAYLIDNPWTVSLARADLAGLILADSLIDRNLGSRPITLVGFSLGARVIYACLKELAKKNQVGIIQNVYLFGSPVVVNADEYVRLRSIVPGRFVNGYASKDWILGYLFRATSGGLRQVAGLAPIDIKTIENVNVTEHVPGHMSYRKAMPRILRELGWAVESDEFSEIEDPDPDNHEKRQRELINEIEEARREIEEAERKKKKNWWNFSAKNKQQKKGWEVYQEDKKEKAAAGGIVGALGLGGALAASSPKEDDSISTLESKADGVLFDLDALQAEIAELAAQGITVKELPESTLPPMRIELPSEPRSNSTPSTKSPIPPHLQNGERRHTEADIKPDLPDLERSNTMPPVAAKSEQAEMDKQKDERPALTTSKTTVPVVVVNNGLGQANHNAWADEFDDDFGKEGKMEMTFE